MIWDCVIVGGGPAGLTAATYLGRFRREVLVIDASESRMRRIPCTRNVPGFPDGVPGAALHERMLQHAARYGVAHRSGKVRALTAGREGFELCSGEESIRARTVLLATGARLIEPEITDIDAALQSGQLRYCPICDGYEVREARIAVLGGRQGAIQEAHFLRTYSDHVTYLWLSGHAPTADERAEAERAGVRLAAEPVAGIEISDCVRIRDEAGAVLVFDTLYPSLGCHPRSELAAQVKAAMSPEGGLVTDTHQQTSVEGLYSAGDVLQGLDQIASACGQGAIAAVAIHNALSR
jgi:thioredoxin reductase (NADPH)